MSSISPKFGLNARRPGAKYFDQDLQRRLAESLPKVRRENGLNSRFIDATAVAIERTRANQPYVTEAAHQTYFLEVAGAAKTLKTALFALSGKSEHFSDLNAMFKYLRHASDLPKKLPDDTPPLAELLTRLHHDLEALQIGCTVAGEHLAPSRDEKPSVRWAAWLVHQVATCYLEIYGAYPPPSKTAWFAKYMAVVGDASNLKIGHVTVRKAVDCLVNAQLLKVSSTSDP